MLSFKSSESPAILGPYIDDTTLCVLKSQILTLDSFNRYILIPASTDKDVAIFFFEFDRKDAIVMPLFMPLNGTELMSHLLSIFVIYSDKVIFAC